MFFPLRDRQVADLLLFQAIISSAFAYSRNISRWIVGCLATAAIAVVVAYFGTLVFSKTGNLVRNIVVVPDSTGGSGACPLI